MKSLNTIFRTFRNTLVAITLSVSLNAAVATPIEPTVDNFTDPQKNTLGIDRQFLDDSAVGGQTTTHYRIRDGVLSATGDIAPPRGQPGWASIVLLFDPRGLPRDASAYEGVRLVLRIKKGNLSVSANSAEITNFDYHAAPVAQRRDGEFQEVKIPFTEMKRNWSAQTPLNTSTLTSLSIVAFDVRKGSFEYEIKEVALY